jgi:nucleotide-binding universal stress UspA family protein
VHVLLPTDGSDIALEAATRGLTLLAAATKVTLLDVTSDLPLDTGGGIEGPILTPDQADDMQKSEEAGAQRSMADTQAAIKAVVAPNATIDQRTEMGDAAAVICSVARDLGVDVVVIGSHGKGFLSRVLLGSVSEHVTRHAPCPVLVVRAAAAATEPASA